MNTILLIEDTKSILENLSEYLEIEGYTVLTARSGTEGIMLAQQCLPDLIICDVLMPQMDGHAVLRTLLVNEDTRHIPFIFSTSMSEKIDRNSSLALGAVDYIVKPFEPEDLLAMIQKWISAGGKQGAPQPLDTQSGQSRLHQLDNLALSAI